MAPTQRPTWCNPYTLLYFGLFMVLIQIKPAPLQGMLHRTSDYYRYSYRRIQIGLEDKRLTYHDRHTYPDGTLTLADTYEEVDFPEAISIIPSSSSFPVIATLRHDILRSPAAYEQTVMTRPSPDEEERSLKSMRDYVKAREHFHDFLHHVYHHSLDNLTACEAIDARNLELQYACTLLCSYGLCAPSENSSSNDYTRDISAFQLSLASSRFFWDLRFTRGPDGLFDRLLAFAEQWMRDHVEWIMVPCMTLVCLLSLRNSRVAEATLTDRLCIAGFIALTLNRIENDDRSGTLIVFTAMFYFFSDRAADIALALTQAFWRALFVPAITMNLLWAWQRGICMALMIISNDIRYTLGEFADPVHCLQTIFTLLLYEQLVHIGFMKPDRDSVTLLSQHIVMLPAFHCVSCDWATPADYGLWILLSVWIDQVIVHEVRQYLGGILPLRFRLRASTREEQQPQGEPRQNSKKKKKKKHSRHSHAQREDSTVQTEAAPAASLTWWWFHVALHGFHAFLSSLPRSFTAMQPYSILATQWGWYGFPYYFRVLHTGFWGAGTPSIGPPLLPRFPISRATAQAVRYVGVRELELQQQSDSEKRLSRAVEVQIVLFSLWCTFLSQCKSAHILTNWLAPINLDERHLLTSWVLMDVFPPAYVCFVASCAILAMHLVPRVWVHFLEHAGLHGAPVWTVVIVAMLLWYFVVVNIDVFWTREDKGTVVEAGGEDEEEEEKETNTRGIERRDAAAVSLVRTDVHTEPVRAVTPPRTTACETPFVPFTPEVFHLEEPCTAAGCNRAMSGVELDYYTVTCRLGCVCHYHGGKCFRMHRRGARLCDTCGGHVARVVRLCNRDVKTVLFDDGGSA